MEIKNLAAAVVCGTFIAGASIAEDWDMPMAYSATNFHSEMGVVFARPINGRLFAVVGR